MHKLVKPASTRWLSVLDSVVRTLKQWDALFQDFATCSDVKDQVNVQQWVG